LFEKEIIRLIFIWQIGLNGWLAVNHTKTIYSGRLAV
jgi:hypothetical protein